MTETLDELVALGNEGAPQEWINNLTGEGVGEGFEGVHGDELNEIMSFMPDLQQEIQATYEIFMPCRSHSANYTKGRQGRSIQYLVIHYTAGSKTAEGAAQANCIYFSNGSRGASAHYFLDDGYTIMQSVDEADTAWHAGVWSINTRSIGIEVCTSGVFTENEIERLTWLVQHLMTKYNIPADHVIRHFDANGKHCPAYYVDIERWRELHTRITTSNASSLLEKPETTPVPVQPKPQPTTTKGEKVYYPGRVVKGSTGTKVKMFQCIANIRFGFNLAVDGSCGFKTEAAIIEIQKRLGLTQDGSCGPDTWTAILSA